MSVETDDPLVGTKLDDYQIERCIGSGATGVVYAARVEDRVVAVKVLNEALGQIKSLRRRFEREARALSKLMHESVVQIEDFGVTDDVVYIVMEYLEGETLEERLAFGPVGSGLALEVCKQILRGVAVAHQMQIVHRDIKPANVFLLGDPTRDGTSEERPPRIKVLDFGLAKFLSIEELSHEGTLTRRGRVVGTPAYMAPEQITGVSLDVRADVYAVGVMLFELLADRRPFDSERRSKLLRAHLFEEVPRLAEVRPGLVVDPALESLVRRALAKDPAERFQDAAEMLEELEPFDAAAAQLTKSARSRSRSRQKSTSVLLSVEELASASDVDKPLAGPIDPPSEASITGVRSDVPLGGLPSERPPAPLGAPHPSTTAKTEIDRSDPPPPRQPWHQSGWVTALVWLLGLAAMGAVVAIAIYATGLR